MYLYSLCMRCIYEIEDLYTVWYGVRGAILLPVANDSEYNLSLYSAMQGLAPMHT